MSYGEHHAKQIVIDEANALAHQLQNGKGDDQQVQGKAIAHLVKMITPLYEAELITVQECVAARARCTQRILNKLEAIRLKYENKYEHSTTQMKEAKIKFMGFEISGTPVTSIILKLLGLVPFLVLFYMMAKMLKWF